MIVDQLFTTYTVVGNTRQFFSESRHNKMLKEDVTYRKFHNLSRMIVERRMSEKEILDLFAAIEAGANATGQNRTALGRGKDVVAGAYNSAKDAISGVLNSIQMSTPVAGVDAAYNDATGALRDAVGSNSKIMDSIKKYRLLAKEYPKTQLFVKTALIGLAGLATGGAGAVAIAGLTAAVDAAIKGEKLSSIIGKGVGAGLMGLGAQEVAAALSAPSGPMGDPDFYNDTPLPAGDPDFYNNPSNTPSVPGEYSDAANNAYQQNPDPSDAPVDPNTRADYTQPGAGSSTYTVTANDFKGLGKIAQDNGITAQQLWDANPQITDPNKIFIGQEINMPAASGEPIKNVWQDWEGPTKPNAPAVNPGPTDTVPPASTPAPMGDPDFNKIDYSKPGPVTADSMGQKLEYNIPVNDQGSFKAPNPGLQPEELAGQKASYDNWLADFKSRFPNAVQQPDGSWNAGKPGLAPMYPSNINPNATAADLANNPFRPKNESINYKIIPADQLIDQKLTVMAWALNESTGRASTRNIHLTRKGVYTVIENVDRYRRVMLKELDAMGPNRTNIPAVPRQDMPAADQTGAVKPGMIGRGLKWLDRTAGKVGGYLSKQAQNFTRKVTAAKLKTEWEQKGHFTDSDQIAAFLAQQGVPQGVITDVYGKMGIPYTAPATVPNGTQPQQQGAGGAADLQTGDIYNIDPSTGKPYGRNKLAADLAAKQAASVQTSNTPALTGGPTAGLPPATGSTPAPGKVTQPNNTTSFNATNVMQMPGMEKYAKTATKAPAKTANFGGGPTGYSKTTMGFKAPAMPTAPGAPKAPVDQKLTPNQYVKKIGAPALPETIAQVKKMLETVETRDDVAFIKKYINREFQRHGLVSESSQAHRSHLLSEVTRIGALRRRCHSQQTAI
jgi:LysM repeat protein